MLTNKKLSEIIQLEERLRVLKDSYLKRAIAENKRSKYSRRMIPNKKMKKTNPKYRRRMMMNL